MKRKTILFFYLLLLTIGLAYETQSLTEGWMSGSQYGIVGLSTLILLVYALPAVWALFHFAKKWKLSWVPVLFSLLGGGFVAGWLSSFANTYFHDMVQAVAPNSSFWNQFESAIAAPLFEEPFKLLPIFFVLYLFSVRRIKSIFLLDSRLWRILLIFVRICLEISPTRCQGFSVVWPMRLCLTGSTPALSCWDFSCSRKFEKVARISLFRLGVTSSQVLPFILWAIPHSHKS